jgi:hypothetical protein
VNRSSRLRHPLINPQFAVINTKDLRSDVQPKVAVRMKQKPTSLTGNNTFSPHPHPTFQPCAKTSHHRSDRHPVDQQPSVEVLQPLYSHSHQTTGGQKPVSKEGYLLRYLVIGQHNLLKLCGIPSPFLGGRDEVLKQIRKRPKAWRNAVENRSYVVCRRRERKPNHGDDIIRSS